MIELQVLNKVLKDKTISMLRQHDISTEYFVTYKAEAEFLFSHYQQYNNIPDRETMLNKFPEFDIIDVTETDRYLVEKLQEQYTYTQMVPVVHKIAELVQTDANEAVAYARTAVDTVFKSSGQYKTGYDIIRNANDRANEHKKRVAVEGLLGITTGITELDEILHGWLNEDFITITGRTNEGKTWVMLFFLVVAWRAGNPILLYSGEMSKTLVGFRFDTLNEHFSNLGLMNGNTELGTKDEPKKPEQYYEYCTNLSKTDVPFIVVTPKDLNGRRLDIPKLHALIETHNPKMVGIDQVTLMDDYRRQRGDNQPAQLTHISEDLYTTSEKYGIPVMSPSQAGRSSVSKKKGKGDGNEDTGKDAPELDQIHGSDGIPQNATRVISIKQIDVTLKMAVKKNRYGLNKQEVLMLWDIDHGVFKSMLSHNGKTGESTISKDYTAGEDLF